jgi:tRNA threonylcarbamoyladenosine modification (KEOPS) complex  Pcc1 subunit
MKVRQISARDVKLLRSCVTGMLRHTRLVAQTIG